VIRVGTSGYVYKHWKDLLYAGIPARGWFDRFTQVFDTVELNTTFYRLPTASMVDGWRENAPEGFLFACKGSRYLTHLKRLKEAGQGLDRYFELILRLGEKLGPVLWQLPPQMNRQDLPRLEAFLLALPKERRGGTRADGGSAAILHAVEFRSAAWYTDECCALLDRYGAAFCEHDLVDRAPPGHTGGFRYLRFHGATGKYQGRYGKRGLWRVASSLADYRGSSFTYFNNDISGHAVHDALDLLELLDLLPAEAADAVASLR
jgi:uncharacterized protein YecE (DUF72 family)